MKTLIRAACAVFVCVLLAGCGLLGGPDVALTFDDPLEAKLNELSKNKQSARLSDLTDFEWDQVHVFYEGADKKRVEQIVGEPVFKNKHYSSSGSLLVFEKDGRVVRSVAMTGEYIRGDKPSWDADVMLQPYGLGYLRLTPGG